MARVRIPAQPKKPQFFLSPPASTLLSIVRMFGMKEKPITCVKEGILRRTKWKVTWAFLPLSPSIHTFTIYRPPTDHLPSTYWLWTILFLGVIVTHTWRIVSIVTPVTGQLWIVGMHKRNDLFSTKKWNKLYYVIGQFHMRVPKNHFFQIEDLGRT